MTTALAISLAVNAVAVLVWLISRSGRSYELLHLCRWDDTARTWLLIFSVDGVETHAIGRRDEWSCRWSGAPLTDHTDWLAWCWSLEMRCRQERRRDRGQAIITTE